MKKNEMISNCERALKRFAKMGLPVIPCKGKIPVLKNWQVGGIPTLEQIEQWGKNYGDDLNIGLVLGKVSGIIGIDIDGEAAKLRLNELSFGDLPVTWTFSTPGGGKRLLYRLPAGVNAKKYVETLEGEHSELALLGDGQQTILPPSIHPNGNQYKWFKGKKPGLMEIANAPNWILKLMSMKKTIEKPNKAAVVQKSGNSEKVFARLAKNCECFKKVLEKQKVGEISEDDWHFWSRLLVSAGHGEAALDFSRLSCKHDKRSEERIKLLVEDYQSDEGMIRCTTFRCSEVDIEKCFPKINEDIDGNPTNSPGRFIKEMNGIIQPTHPAYTPYLNALEDITSYDVDEKGNLCSFDKKGNAFTVANFVARPVLEVVRDDGESEQRTFRITGHLAGARTLPMVDVTATEFVAMNWVLNAWGIEAAIGAGSGKKDMVRDAIQNMAPGVEQLRIFTHLGWRKLDDGKWVYLHANGCIGSNNIEVEIEKSLSRYCLPDKGVSLEVAGKASLSLLNLAPREVTIPLLSLVYLSPLTEAFKRAGHEPEFVLWMYGVSGTRKTSIAKIFLSHFGNFATTAPPASFKDTANALERKAFATKDSLLLVDDYHPMASRTEADKMEQIAQRVLRMYGDRISRGRLTSKIEFQKEYPPRGEVLVTGEDLPRGFSTVARLMGVEILKEQVNLENLTEAQSQPHLYAEAMTGYIRWIAERMEKLPPKLAKMFKEERTNFQAGAAHGRLGDAAAWLYIGFEIMLLYMEEIGICRQKRKDRLLLRARKILIDIVKTQGVIVEEEKPVDIFLRVLSELFVAKKVRVESIKTGKPTMEFFVGEMIGWEDANTFFLLPEATFSAVNRFLSGKGQHFPVRERMLWKNLEESNMIITETGADGKTQRLLKKVIPNRKGEDESNVRPRLLHLLKSALKEK